MRIGTIGFNTQYAKFGQSFLGAKFFLKEGEKLNRDELDYEAAQAEKARQGGVCVPKYRMKENEFHVEHIRYETKGDAADFKTNPVKGRHFRSILKNLYFMDRAGIFHKNLRGEHIFLQNDGQVEIDCFRDTVNFNQRYSSLNRPGVLQSFPDFVMPSNEEAFKTGYLCEYMSSPYEEDKNYFMKNYLSYSSDYHQRRANFLARRGPYKAFEFEATLSEVYLNPSRRVVSFEIDKLSAEKQRVDALSDWEQKENPENIDPKRRFDSILKQLKCIETMVNIKDVAEYFSENSMTERERKYFSFEEEIARKKLEALLAALKNTGALTFFDPDNKISLGCEDEKEFFLELCEETDLRKSQKTIDAIRDIREYYTELKDRWNTGLNKIFMESYQGLYN